MEQILKKMGWASIITSLAFAIINYRSNYRL